MTTSTLITMLSYSRKSGSKSHRQFCNRFLAPVFGEPDLDGNYVKHIGDSRMIFAAHHDSVDRQSGRKSVIIDGDIARLAKGSPHSCLGADCATGVWILLHMIGAGIPGTYIVHADEESGTIGASSLISRRPAWLDGKDTCISFDRRGTNSVVTHQMGRQTCSTAFAQYLADGIGLGMKPDPNGAFTDSEAYADTISECTNISVGYYAQHSANEHQDLAFAQRLAGAVLNLDWEAAPIRREPISDYRGFGWSLEPRGQSRREAMRTLCREYPHLIADMLLESGFDADELEYHCGVDYRWNS